MSSNVAYAHYAILGKIAFVQFSLTATAAGAAGGITVTGVPAAIEPADTGNVPIGVGLILDGSVAWYPSVLTASSANTYQFFGYAETDILGLDPAFELANNDLVQGQAVYKIA